MQNPLTKFIPLDKQLHIGVGLLIGLGATLVTKDTNVGMGLSILAGVGKEGYDWIMNRRAAAAGLPRPHDVELLDAVATVAGGFLGSLAGYIALRLL